MRLFGILSLVRFLLGKRAVFVLALAALGYWGIQFVPGLSGKIPDLSGITSQIGLPSQGGPIDMEPVEGNLASRYPVNEHPRPAEGSVEIKNATATLGFSPRGDGEKIIVQAIKSAQSTILVQAYSFTNKNILAALKQAKQRGVDVRVILDVVNDQQRYSGGTYMTNAGVPVWIDEKVKIAHNKVIIIDTDTVITGSFNFSAAAQTSNAENVLIIQGSVELANQYINNWLWRLSQSRIYQPH